MKKTKRFLSMLLVFTMLFALVGCKKAEETTEADKATETVTEAPVATPELPEGASFLAGTYTAKGKGIGGDVEVQVVVTDTAIETITILSHNETAGISDPAIKDIPANIIAAQGLKVDAISGATMTSDAILTAVTDCLTQAGADIEALKLKAAEAVVLEDEVIEADVVVVGAGIAGLSAAVTAAEEGAKVVLLEKMPSVGGASIVCGGEVLAAGTQAQADQGIEDTSEALANYWIEIGGDKVNKEILSFIAENSENTVNWLKDRGTEFRNVTYSYYYPTQNPYRNHATVNYSGADFIMPLYETAQNLGVEIRLETPAVSLINENGTIKGVVAENAGRTITVNAKGTILATGGFGNNQELMEQYSPKIQAFGSALGAAHNGDGLIMARDAGAEIVANGGAIAGPMDLGATRYVDAGGIFLNVTPEGARFGNENEYWFKRNAALYHDHGFATYYAITDSKLENENLEAAIEAGSTFKADTIEELATLIGADASVLASTVSRYNELCAAGEDTDFGKPAVGPVGNREEYLQELQLLNAVDQGPFYAIEFKTNSVTGTFGGPKTNLDGEVIATTGETIPGLYAAGEVANGELFNLQYPCSGSSIQMSATMGIQAGKASAALAK